MSKGFLLALLDLYFCLFPTPTNISTNSDLKVKNGTPVSPAMALLKVFYLLEAQLVNFVITRF